MFKVFASVALLLFGIAIMGCTINIDVQSTDSCSAELANRNLDQAIAACDQIIRRDPKDAAAYNNRGFAYLQKGNLDQALADLNRAIELDPKDAVAFANRAGAFEQKNNLDQARV